MIPDAQRFGSVTEVMYECNDCFTGGGSATCQNGQWDFEAKCEGRNFRMLHTLTYLQLKSSTKHRQK